jgi:electron transfer flavoprotein beta subunit
MKPMPLNVVVCIKQVPHPEHFSRITLDPARQTITREGIPAIINPLDRHALEEALKIREQFSGKVTAISMGPPQARQALEEALAIGADNAMLLCDKSFAGADTLATAYSLACGIKKLGDFALILCGNETVDSATGQVGPQLAELLDVPHVTSVIQISFEQGNTLIAKQALEQGYMKVRVKLPALLAVAKEINQPRLPTVLGIMEARNKELQVWGTSDIEATPDTIGLAGSPTQVAGIFKRDITRRREILKGTPEQITKKAVERLRELLAT